MSPKLSIILGVHNQEELVLTALEHMPVRDDVELIVLDNASTDKSLAVVEMYQAAHPELHMTVLHNKVEVNPCINGNRLIEMSRGEYFHLHCDDDYVITPEFERVIDTYLYSQESYDVVTFDLQQNDGFRLPVDENTHTWRSSFIARFVKKSFVKGLKMREDKFGEEDQYFNREILERNPKIAFSGIMAYRYNYPRVGSISWRFAHGELDLGEFAGEEACEL